MSDMEKGYSYLLKNLSDSIFEMMLKLGESHNSSMCIYYTPDLAAYLLGMDEKAVDSEMAGFKVFVNNELGRTDIEKASDGRIGIRVYSEGIDKIMASNPRKHFLQELIDKIRGRNCSIDEIKEIFEKESSDFVCEEIDDSEFQYVVYFKDKNIDESKYCVTFDVMGSYY
ncbi:MAG: DUF3877 family protein, partial [Clostridiales bacterium]|nr:DUF3877 family protein [Clostridiales bacterium]